MYDVSDKYLYHFWKKAQKRRKYYIGATIDQRSSMFTVWGQKVPTKDFCRSVGSAGFFSGYGSYLITT